MAWGYDLNGKRVLRAVILGQRERREEWLELGRDLVRRGLPSPWLVVTDGAPGLVRAVEELWPEADRQRCSVHRAAQHPGQAPAVGRRPEARLGRLLGRARQRCLARGGGGRAAHQGARTRARVPQRHRLPGRGSAGPLHPPALPAPPVPAAALDQLARAFPGRGAPTRPRHRPLPGRDTLPEPLLGRARPGGRWGAQPRLLRPQPPAATPPKSGATERDEHHADRVTGSEPWRLPANFYSSLRTPPKPSVRYPNLPRDRRSSGHWPCST